MPLVSRSWTLNRLRGRLHKVERAKDQAMQALIVRDRQIDQRSRFDYQDPGQIGSMLDEIAVLQERIAGLETPDRHDPYLSAAEPPQPARARPPDGLDPEPCMPAAHGALDPAFQLLRAELSRLQQVNGGIGVDALRQALGVALSSTEVLDAAFQALRAEMTRMQRAAPPGGIGLEALHHALRLSLGGIVEAAPDRLWDGCWPEPDFPGFPLNADQDGWHWVRAPGKPFIVLSWHADTHTWRHRAGISPDRIAADQVRYFGPCSPPVVAEEEDVVNTISI